MLGCDAEMTRPAGTFVSNTSAAHHTIQRSNISLGIGPGLASDTLWLGLQQDCSIAHSGENSHREIKFPVTLSVVHTISGHVPLILDRKPAINGYLL
jgi:hypothetical protein